MKKRIHVNQHIIRNNRKRDRNELSGDYEPPVTVQTYKGPSRGFEVSIHDDSGKEVARVVYRPTKPLSCGARLWIETENKILIDDKIVIE